MKKAPIAAAAALLTALFAGPAIAEEADLTACTHDGQTATLKVNVAGHTQDGKESKEVVHDVWKKTAASLDAEALKGAEGHHAFFAALNEAAKQHPGAEDADFSVVAPPTTGFPACIPN